MKGNADAWNRVTKCVQPYWLREFQSVPFMPRSVSKEFRAWCERMILPHFKFGGYKQEQKREELMKATLALVETGIADKVIADSRNTHHPGVRRRKQTWDVLVRAGLCRKCLGSEQSGKVSRYQATMKLLRLEKEWSQELLRPPKEQPSRELLGLVIFKRKEAGKPATVPFDAVIRKYAPRDSTGQPDRKSVSTGIAVTRVVEEFINQINGENLNHAWKTCKQNGVYFQPNVELVQMHIRQPFRGTRLYTPAITGGQNISKAERQRLRIDGSRVSELDFSGSIPRLAYHTRQISVPAGMDIYMPHKIAPEGRTTSKRHREATRNFIKLATLICFNVGSRSQAIGALTQELFKRNEAERRLLRQLPKPAQLVKRIAVAHSRIVDDLFADRGMRLVSIEGGIMLQILLQFVVGAKKPALPIHDALVVRDEDAAFAKQVMEKVYRHATGFNPVVKVKNF